VRSASRQTLHEQMPQYERSATAKISLGSFSALFDVKFSDLWSPFGGRLGYVFFALIPVSAATLTVDKLLQQW